MKRRGIVSMAVAVVVVIVVIVAAEVGFWSVRASQPLLFEFHAPRDYSGWLVVSWNCSTPEPERLADGHVDGRRYSFDFSDTGTLCLADPIPADGYVVLTYRHSGPNNGLSDGLVSSPFLRAGPQEVRRDDPGTTSVDPAIGAGTNHRYDIAWVQVRQKPARGDAFPGDLRLGNQCDLDRFLQQQFGEPAANVQCSPIPSRLDAGLHG